MNAIENLRRRAAAWVARQAMASPELRMALERMRQDAAECERARVGAILELAETEKLLKPAIALAFMGDISPDRARRILSAMAQDVAPPAAEAPPAEQRLVLH